MRRLQQRILSGVPAACALIVATALFTGCQRGPDVHLELVADDLVFRGDNPTLRVAPGSRVRLTVRNEADGVIHRLRIPELDVETATLQPGEAEPIDFRAPDKPIALTYTCEYHALMHGKLIVGPDPGTPVASSRPNPTSTR